MNKFLLAVLLYFHSMCAGARSDNFLYRKKKWRWKLQDEIKNSLTTVNSYKYIWLRFVTIYEVTSKSKESESLNFVFQE